MFKKDVFNYEMNKKIFECAFNTTMSSKKDNQLVQCVFHEDTTSSLSVNISKGLYFCFGCGEKGNTQKLLRLINEGVVQ